MRYMILAAIGLVLAVAVVIMLKSGRNNTPENEGDMVLVAKSDLQPGSFIVVANHVSLVDMPEREIKPPYIQRKNINFAELDGAVVRNLIKAGEPIQKDKIVTPKEGGFLSAVLYPGKRAISVGVDVVSANAGFIFPGDRVDLLLTHEIENMDSRKSFATETFVEDVRVLAIDQQASNPDKKALVPKTVTLEVTPKEAEEVLVATELGKISLVLRSSGSAPGTDTSRIKTYTKDKDVSSLIKESNPADDNNVDVTITRGKTTIETKVNPGSEVIVESPPENTSSTPGNERPPR